MERNMTEITEEKILGCLAKIADFRLEEDNLFEVDVNKVLSSDMSKIKLTSIREDINVMITEYPGCSYHIGRECKGGVSRCKALPFQEWDHRYSVKTYGAKMAEVLKALEKNDKNLRFDNTDENGEYFDVWYWIKFSENTTVRDAIQLISNLEKELDGHTDLMLHDGTMTRDMLQNEEEFSLRILVPLFRSMGYVGVQYNHGFREFGKDIIFSEIDKLDIRRNFGVQVKAGDLSGEASSELDKLIGQIDDAFKLSYFDKYSRITRYITDLIIAIAGRFIGNATQKIQEKIHRDDVHFFDIDRIEGLLAKHMKKKIGESDLKFSLTYHSI